MRSIDDSAAKKVKGYISSLALEDPSDTVPGWVMVFANSYPAAIRAADLVKVDWAAGRRRERLRAGCSRSWREADRRSEGRRPAGGRPGPRRRVSGAQARRSERTYTTSSVLHCQLEPVNALAFEKDGIFEIHTGNQWQSLILPVLAKALGLPQERIVLRTYALGGGFGRRLNGDYTVPAALAAKALGKPVKMVLTRPDDMRFDSFRSPSIQTLRMAFDAGGKVTAMEHHASAGWPTLVMAPGFMVERPARQALRSFRDRGRRPLVRCRRAARAGACRTMSPTRAFRPGWLRSVGPGWTNWAVESFMDEAAHAARRRSRRVPRRRCSMARAAMPARPRIPSAARSARRRSLQRAAQKAGWGAAMPKDTGLGIATTFGQERDMPTWIACVARVRVDRGSGVVTVEKLTIVVDAGTIVRSGRRAGAGRGRRRFGASAWRCMKGPSSSKAR